MKILGIDAHTVTHLKLGKYKKFIFINTINIQVVFPKSTTRINDYKAEVLADVIKLMKIQADFYKFI